MHGKKKGMLASKLHAMKISNLSSDVEKYNTKSSTINVLFEKVKIK